MSITMPAAYTIKLLAGVDQSMSPINCIDKFQIKGDGVPLFDITLDYCANMDEGPQVARAEVRCHSTEFTPEHLPFVMNAFHLISTVTAKLDALLSVYDAEFYADLFVDDNGSPTELRIEFY